MRSLLPGENKKFWMAAVHAAVWVVYIGFLFVANKLSNPSINLGYAFLSMLPYLLAFYVSIFWLNRYKKMGVFLSILSFVGTFLVLGAIGYAYMYIALPSANIRLYETDQFRDFIKYAVLGYIQYYSYALLYFVIRGFFNKERALRELQEEKYVRELENAKLKEQELKAQKEKLQIEYAFLRAQVNPHFLQNTLNTLYSQAQEHSEALAANISNLSNMMRYSFENIDQETDLVPVEKELKNLSRLIEINRVRYEGNEAVDFKMEGEIEDQMLPPLSLITIVENAFKYGDLTDRKHPLMIRIRLQPDHIFFFCRNKIQPRELNDTSHNVGLANLKRRLEVLYEDKHSIVTHNTKGFYTIELTIKT